MPLDSWLALYRAAESQRVEELAAILSAFHVKNPKQMRERLMRLAVEVMYPKPSVAQAAKRFAAMLTGRRGVAVKGKGGLKKPGIIAGSNPRRKARRIGKRN